MIDAPESDRLDPAPAAPPAPVAERPRRGGGLFNALVLVALALAFAGMWWVARMSRAMYDVHFAADATYREENAKRFADLAEARKTLETRLADATATNRVLREELLAMGERATLLEDAVGRLADNRMRGEVMLRLNEAEFLLLLGEERLRLFGDVPAAIQAYTLTDAALAGLDDPSLATLRQTLAQELIALRDVPVDPRPAVRAELAQMAAKLALLPASRAGEVATADANDSRLVRLLAGLVTVRRVSERDAVLGPVQRETALAALRLQLELAQAALARPDAAGFRHAIDSALAQAAQLFDARDDQVERLAVRLRSLRETTLVPELPVLGATLQELRGLRATRSIGTPAPSVPAIDPAPVPSPVPADGAGA